MCVLMIAVMALLSRSLRRSMAKLRHAVAELRASEEQAHHMAYHDVLTGLPNRALFENKLDRVLLTAGVHDSLAVLMLDLDRFKHVNDTLGHQAGDCVVREFGQRLSELLRSSDAIAKDLAEMNSRSCWQAFRVKRMSEAVCLRILESVPPNHSMLPAGKPLSA